MSSGSIKRILNDITKLKESPLENDGVYWHIDEDNIYDFRALIIGPSGTPYDGGFFFFSFSIPLNYPLDPPKVEYHTQYQTQYNKIRFNPNLYTNGKVCLSILNTWEGPSWTPCNTLSSVLISILAMVFVEHPLVNEPGFEHANFQELDSYDAFIEYASLKGATLHMLNNIPKGFDVFLPQIEEHFVANYSKYMSRSKKLFEKRDKKTYVCGAYNMQLKCDYEGVIKELRKKREDLTGIKEEERNKLDILLPMYSKITVKELRILAKDVGIPVRQDGKYILKKVLYNSVEKKMNN